MILKLFRFKEEHRSYFQSLCAKISYSNGRPSSFLKLCTVRAACNMTKTLFQPGSYHISATHSFQVINNGIKTDLDQIVSILLSG